MLSLSISYFLMLCAIDVFVVVVVIAAAVVAVVAVAVCRCRCRWYYDSVAASFSRHDLNECVYSTHCAEMDSHRSSRQVTQFSSVTQSKRSCVFPFCTLNEWVFKCNRCTYESSFHSSSKQSCIVWHILSSVHVILFTFVPNQNNWIFVYLYRWEKKKSKRTRFFRSAR